MMTLLRRQTAEETFQTCDLDNLLMLRLAGFVKDTQAHLVRISEKGAVIDLGGQSFGDWFHGRPYLPGVRVGLKFSEVETPGPNRMATIHAVVRPRGIATSNFDSIAKHVLNELRGYFVAV